MFVGHEAVGGKTERRAHRVRGAEPGQVAKNDFNKKTISVILGVRCKERADSGMECHLTPNPQGGRVSSGSPGGDVGDPHQVRWHLPGGHRKSPRWHPLPQPDWPANLKVVRPAHIGHALRSDL